MPEGDKKDCSVIVALLIGGGEARRPPGADSTVNE